MNTRVKFGSALSLQVGQFSVGVNTRRASRLRQRGDRRLAGRVAPPGRRHRAVRPAHPGHCPRGRASPPADAAARRGPDHRHGGAGDDRQRARVQEFKAEGSSPPWRGLVPGQYSSGCKTRLGRITKAGDGRCSGHARCSGRQRTRPTASVAGPRPGGYGERFVRTDGEVWHALRDSFHLDGTACLSARVDGAVPRWHDLDDGKGTHQFVVRQFGGRWWGRAIREHSMTYEVGSWI